MYFYDDNAPRAAFGGGNYHDMPATRKFLEHFSNMLMLKFFWQEGTHPERFQVDKEIVICERKLTYWKRHPNWNIDEVTRGIEQMKRDWAGKISHETFEQARRNALTRSRA